MLPQVIQSRLHPDRNAAQFESERPLPQAEGVFDEARIPTVLEHGSVEVGRSTVNWTMEIPENLAYDGLGFFIQGYHGIKQSSRAPRNALAQQGIANVSFDPARKGEESLLDCFRDPQDLHTQTIQAISKDIEEKSYRYKKDIMNGNKIDYKKRLLVSHSMGGLSAVRFAKIEPGKIDAIYGLATVGLVSPGPRELATDIPKGIIASVKHEFLPCVKSGAIEISTRNLKDMVRYYSGLRVLFEGLSCMSHKVIDDVSLLAEKGVPYHYLAFERDILVRPNPEIAKYVTDFVVMAKYGHLAPQAKSTKVARHISQSLHGQLAA